MHRDYSTITLNPPADAAPLLDPAGQPTDAAVARMRSFVDLLWTALRDHDVSWAGFYHRDPEDATQLVLGPLRDKPACSPIGLHGACGQCLLSERPLVVPDVSDLGDGYIACDPRDVAEVVVPCVLNGRAWAVLDLDSFSRNAFDADDAVALADLLVRAGLSDRSFAADDVTYPGA